MDRLLCGACGLFSLSTGEQIILVLHFINVQHQVSVNILMDNEFFTFPFLLFTVLGLLGHIVDVFLISNCTGFKL
ncbi:hypothetical protein D3C76_1791980 [compost metagenome]